MKSKMIFGFHAVTSRLRHEAVSVEEIYVDSGRSDRRMQDLVQAAKAAGVRVIPTDDQRLSNIVGTRRHQGVGAGQSRQRRRAADVRHRQPAARATGRGAHGARTRAVAREPECPARYPQP